MACEQGGQPGDAQVWLEVSLILALAVGMWRTVEALACELGAGGGVAPVVGAIVSIPCALGLLGWRIGEYRRRERRRTREREQEERSRAEQQREYERSLQQQAEEVGARLPIHVLRSFQERGIDWQPIVRAVRDQRDAVARVCDTDLATIGGYEFEDWTSDLFQVLGWSTQVTQRSADKGVDIFIERAGQRAVVQCKCYSTSPIGGPDARQLLGSLLEQDAQKAFLVATTTYTRDAQEVAEASRGKLELVSSSDLENWVETIREIRRQATGEAAPAEQTGENSHRAHAPPRACPSCGHQVRWECETCPKCGSTLPQNAAASAWPYAACVGCVLAPIGLWFLVAIIGGIGTSIRTAGWEIDVLWEYNQPALRQQPGSYPECYYYPIWVRVTNGTTEVLDLHPDAFHIMAADGADCGGWGNSTDAVRSPLTRRDLPPGGRAEGNIAIPVLREHASEKFRIRYEGPWVAEHSIVRIRRYSESPRASGEHGGLVAVSILLVLTTATVAALVWRVRARAPTRSASHHVTKPSRRTPPLGPQTRVK